MAKASPLSSDLLQPPTPVLPVRPLTAAISKPHLPANDALVQIRCTTAQAKAIKRAALEADQTISEYMLVCFHTYIQKSQHQPE